MSKSPTSLLLHNKVLLKSGVIVETKIWRIQDEFKADLEVELAKKGLE